MKNYSLLIITAITLLIGACGVQQSMVAHVKHEVASTEHPAEISQKPRNIILLIGDGMGTAEVFAALTVNGGQANFLRFPYSGFVQTQSADDYITDSAAGGTAIATGKRTTNGTIGMDSVGKQLTSILELAEAQGMSSGLISTSAITHATPASFIAHQPKRSMYEEIAADFLQTDVDLFIGGGLAHFDSRKDGRKLSNELADKGYTVFTEWQNIDYTADKVAALVAPKHLPKYSNGRGDFLPTTVEKSLAFLAQKENGFFIMIEGSQIDWGGHANKIDYVVSETLDFDCAVGKALDFAQSNGETLVIVTADHETGGLNLRGGSMSNGFVKAKFSTRGHTGVMVPLFAYGPGAEIFSGIQLNTDLFHKMVALLDLKAR